MALQRRRSSAGELDRLESQPTAFYERTQQAYEQLMQDHPNRFIAVDAAKPAEDLAQDILGVVLRRLSSAEEIQWSEL